MSRPRAVVVGSGPAGGTVARLLAKSGHYDVVVLDKGRNYFTGLGGDPSRVGNVFANDEVGYESRLSPFSQDPYLEPRSFRTDPSAGPRTFVGDVNDLALAVGGTFAHADVKARRFREVDFITNSLMGGTADHPAITGTTYSDWPLTYHHLEPFYAVMDEVVGVQGPARRVRGRVYNPNPYESPRSTPFALPPGVEQLNSLLAADAAHRLGYSPASVPTAIVSRPYRGRPPCVDCDFCLDFGCPNNAKSGGIWQLNDALLAGAQLVSQANVVRIEWSPAARGSGRYRATGVTYLDSSGQSHTIAADLVVLANTPIEATRLSLVSGISKAPQEQSLSKLTPTSTEPSGLLGRNLMFHLQTVAFAIVNANIHSFRGRTSTHTLDAFVGSGPSPQHFDPSVPMGGILEIGGNLNPVQEASEFAFAVYGSRHKLLMQLGPLHNHLVGLTLQGQDMPQLTNYVDLDPEIVDVYGQPVPRITYHNHQYELETSQYYIPKMLEILETIGGPGSRYPSVRTLSSASLNTTTPAVLPGSVDMGLSPATSATPFSDVPQDKHIMGTHRIALDAAHGPCDPYGRYWAFDNLYHAGGGLFVTAPGYNPTVTMYALSYWLAAAIIAGVGGSPSYAKQDLDRSWPRLLDVIAKLDADTMIARAIRRNQLV